jgi:hypothetical protein
MSGFPFSFSSVRTIIALFGLVAPGPLMSVLPT